MIKKVNLCIIITLIILSIFPIIIYSAGTDITTDIKINEDSYKPGDQLTGDNATRVQQIASKILTILTNIGIVVSVVSIAIIGIKYMLGSVEEKASYKENIFPYITGIILIFGISMIVKAIELVGKEING